MNLKTTFFGVMGLAATGAAFFLLGYHQQVTRKLTGMWTQTPPLLVVAGFGTPSTDPTNSAPASLLQFNANLSHPIYPYVQTVTFSSDGNGVAALLRVQGSETGNYGPVGDEIGTYQAALTKAETKFLNSAISKLKNSSANPVYGAARCTVSTGTATAVFSCDDATWTNVAGFKAGLQAIISRLTAFPVQVARLEISNASLSSGALKIVVTLTNRGTQAITMVEPCTPSVLRVITGAGSQEATVTPTPSPTINLLPGEPYSCALTAVMPAGKEKQPISVTYSSVQSDATLGALPVYLFSQAVTAPF